MGRSIGVLATHYIWVGMVEDTTLTAVRMYPEPGHPPVDLKSVPVDEIIARIRGQIAVLRQQGPVQSVGAGFPGIVRNGVIDDSPNLGQLKGLRIGEQLRLALREDGLEVPVTVMNDTDALAAGIAATRDGMQDLMRVWYLGDGV